MAGTEWLCLIVAGALEPCWVLALGRSEGFTDLRWGAVTLTLLAGSMVFLGLSLTAVPIGVAYAVWTGIGAVGTLAAGMILYKERVTRRRMLFVLLIVTGIAGIRLTGG